MNCPSFNSPRAHATKIPTPPTPTTAADALPIAMGFGVVDPDLSFPIPSFCLQEQSRRPPSPRRGYPPIQPSLPTRPLSRCTAAPSLPGRLPPRVGLNARSVWKYQGRCCQVVVWSSPESRIFERDGPPFFAARNVSRMELAVCHSTTLFARGPCSRPQGDTLRI